MLGKKEKVAEAWRAFAQGEARGSASAAGAEGPGAGLTRLAGAGVAFRCLHCELGRVVRGLKGETHKGQGFKGRRLLRSPVTLPETWTVSVGARVRTGAPSKRSWFQNLYPSPSIEHTSRINKK